MTKVYDAIIIGGGASGMMAAIIAKRRGKNIILLEKNAKLGRKILVTGNGRCNISNENTIEDQRKPIHYMGRNPKFVLSVFNQFGIKETKKFFNELGIEFKEEDKGRLFPSSNQAQSVVDVLEYELQNLNIKIAEKNSPKKIIFNKDNSQYEVTISDGRKLISKKIVVATGGLTLPTTGSNGDGYEYAKQFGHTILPTFPGYVAVKTKSPLCHFLQGVKLEVAVKAYSDGQELAENTGTIMFTHFGLSAPVILEISRVIANEITVKKNKVKVHVNFLPDVKKENLEKFVVERWAKSPNKSLGFSFVGLLPKKVFPAILDANDIDKDMKCSDVKKELRAKIINLLSEYEFIIDDIRDYKDAHFTAGGVDTKELNPKTLESKLQPGLYFSGEVMDIDGICGGYNLQWAWSTGAVVGSNI